VSKTLAPGERIDVAKLEPGVYGMRVIEETDEDRFPAHERFDVRIPAVSVVKIPRN
jgi:hypothetical protein